MPLPDGTNGIAARAAPGAGRIRRGARCSRPRAPRSRDVGRRNASFWQPNDSIEDTVLRRHDAPDPCDRGWPQRPIELEHFDRLARTVVHDVERMDVLSAWFEIHAMHSEPRLLGWHGQIEWTGAGRVGPRVRPRGSRCWKDRGDFPVTRIQRTNCALAGAVAGGHDPFGAGHESKI